MKLSSIFVIRGARDKPKDSYGGSAYSFFFGRSTSGKNVNERTAMQATAVYEEAAYTESDDSFGQASIGAHKVATMMKVSDELLNDSAFNLEAYISKEFGSRIGMKEEGAFFTGDGKGKPAGIFDATGGATDGVITATASITFDDVMDLFYSLKSPYRKKAVWVLNDTTVKALRKLKDNNGNYIWQPSVQEGQPDMILNRPYHTSSYAPEKQKTVVRHPIRKLKMPLLTMKKFDQEH